MADKKSGVAAKVLERIAPVVTGLGYSIWDVTFYKEGADYNLEVAIDKEGGIDIEDCSAVTVAIEPIIDELDPVEDAYYLLVSSAGLERELRTSAHIDFAITNGCSVTAKLFTALDGKKEYSGVITEADESSVCLTENDNKYKIDRKLISRLTARCGE